MIVRKDLLFGSLAVADKTVTDEQLQECLDIQRRQQFYKSIGSVMIEKGYSDRAKINELLRIQ